MSGDSRPFAGGAALVTETGCWILADTNPMRSLGPALFVATKAAATTLDLVVDDAAMAAVLARRAALFDMRINVWCVSGNSLVAAVPAPPLVEVGLDGVTESFVPTIVGAGAEPIIEHGVLTAEVLGLEIARVVPSDIDHSPTLAQGVGRFDREAGMLLNGAGLPTMPLEALAAQVRLARQIDSPTDRMARIGRERLLRSRLILDPSLVGLVHLEAAPPPVLREGILSGVPCVAVGLGADGRRAVVVCSSGIDPDLVPFAADARATLAATNPDLDDADLLLALVQRDLHPMTQRLAAMVLQPAVVCPVT